MTTTSTEHLTGYDATLENASLITRPDANYLRIGGEDRVDYLHRQTTNDVNLLGPERAVLTVLTSPTARIYDVLLLVDEGETIGVVTLPGRGPATAAYFQGRIFFMDKVTVEDISADVAQFDLEGPQAATTLVSLGLAKAPALDEVLAFYTEGVEVRVVGREGLAGMGYRLLAPTSASGAVASALSDAGAAPLDAASYEVLRVEAGLPGPNELTEDYTPLETDLARAVSETKGCYTGQEIIARQITYDKVTKQLARLRLDARVEEGAQVMAEGKSVGAVTSVVESPRYGPIALAVVKRPHHQPGSQLVIGGDEGETAAEVGEFP